MWLLIHASNQRAHCTVTWQLRASLIQSAHSYTLSAWLSNQGSCINHGMHISNRCIVPIMDSESSWALFPFHRGLQWPYRSTRSPDIARMVHASASGDSPGCLCVQHVHTPDQSYSRLLCGQWWYTRHTTYLSRHSPAPTNHHCLV